MAACLQTGNCSSSGPSGSNIALIRSALFGHGRQTMIAKDLPSVKDLRLITCESFVIMGHGQADARTGHKIASYALFACHAGLAMTECRTAVPARRATRRVTTQRDEGAGLTALHGLDAGRRPQTPPAIDGSGLPSRYAWQEATDS